MSGTIDLDNLLNYENQSIPSYISKDNMPSSNQITDEGATLGRVLFYDKKLSIDNSIACASCHKQEFAFSDDAVLSEGVNGQTLRHSMRLVNIRFAEDTLFRWDRTADALIDQMIIPIKKFEEMGYSGTNGAPDFQDLINELSNTVYYPRLFSEAFGDSDITEERIGKALAQFVMSIQSFDSKYDVGRAQVNSDSEPFPNFTDAENAGKALFIDSFAYETDTITVIDAITQREEQHAASRRISGGLNCATCHRPPEFDIDPKSLNNGFIRGNPAQGVRFDFNVTRTPTLRDLVKADGTTNGGMFHAGQAMNLFGITAHYDFRQIDPSNTNLDPRYTPGGLPQWLDMTRQEQMQLNAFMRTLAGNDVYTNEKWSDPFDEDGNITIIGGTTSAGDLHSANNSVQLYPNPVSNQFTISGELSLYQIEIINSTGQIRQTVNSNGSIHLIDISALPSGLYYVRVRNTNNTLLEVQKLIKR